MAYNFALVDNHGVWFRSVSSRGIVGFMLGFLLTGFYILLYWFPEYLTSLIALLNPLSSILRGQQADQWFLYGFLYTFFVVTFGVKFIFKYKNNRYHLIRTSVLIAVQLLLAFLLPAILKKFNEPEFYFSYFWPLKKEYLFPSDLKYLMSSGKLGLFMVFWAVIMLVVVTPVLTYFFGKRWYCSWVCGCGALAETAGDSFRQLSNKTVKAWKFERVIIYSVLALIVGLTVILWVNSFQKGAVLGEASMIYGKWYGFFIGSLFSGVIGTGFYPILGSRVWCRFGCPMAAILGIHQRLFSRFRITTNGGQCISCGNCSTYCEMGIDVRAYAQRQENIVRASCVGCGVCASVCPRGVLKLENGKSPRLNNL